MKSFDEEEILKKVKSIRPDSLRLEIGRNAIFRKHCKEPMIQVRVFYRNYETGGEREGTDEYVCPRCHETLRPLSDLEANSLA